MLSFSRQLSLRRSLSGVIQLGHYWWIKSVMMSMHHMCMSLFWLKCVECQKLGVRTVKRNKGVKICNKYELNIKKYEPQWVSYILPQKLTCSICNLPTVHIFGRVLWYFSSVHVVHLASYRRINAHIEWFVNTTRQAFT